MPLAIAVIGGAALSAGASAFGASQQSGAINSSSKASARQIEEARIINQANLQNTLTAVGPRLEQAGDLANSAVTGADAVAAQDLASGYGAAGQRLIAGGNAASDYLNTGRATIGQGVQGANALLQPYIDTGGRALGMVGDLSGANGVDAGRAALANFQYSPAYQFNLDQGLRAVDAGASARGMLVSGATRRAEQTYGAGLASNEFTNYYNRLSGLASQGLNASNQAGSNIMTGAGNQAGFDRAQAQNAVQTQGGLAALDTGFGTALASNAIGTGARLSSNELSTGNAISNLYTGNATAQAANETGAANNLAQTATSTGSALASIYGNQAQGVGNAINSGLNNYAYVNALAPSTYNYNVTSPTATYAPGQQTLQTAPVAANSGVRIS